MSSKFSMKVVKENKKLNSKTIRMTPTKGKTIDFKDIRNFYNALIKKNLHKADEVQIVGISPDKMRFLGSQDVSKGHTTLKNMNDDIKDIDDDEYYEDLAKDPVKFDKFFFVDFIIIPKN